MGGRGVFKNINTGDFSFVEGGQIYHTVGFDDGIKYLIKSFTNNLTIQIVD